MDQRTKDPVRVATGRLGGLTTKARGAHVTGPARLAWEAKLAAEFGIPDDLPPAERRERLDAAQRVRMSRVARKRWSSTKKPARVTETSRAGQEDRDDTRDRPVTA
jgi:hypothetical protein